jgi:predicted nucleic acid-binding protein
VTKLTFARIDSPRDQNRVAQFLQILDVGEAEALALALEINPEAVLVDEKLGRQFALQHGLKATGTLGVLLEAKWKSLIPLIRPLMERLITEINFRISPRLQADVLKRAGE